MTQTKPPLVVAIASGGGHWVELFRLRPAWAGCRIAYVTTEAGYRDAALAEGQTGDGPAPSFHVIPDANRWQKVRLVRQMLAIARVLITLRPDAVVSTGAAPGYFAIRIGRLLGARTVWVDSIANADELSLSGQRAGPHAHVWLTQWPHLAAEDGKGPTYAGAVL